MPANAYLQAWTGSQRHFSLVKVSLPAQSWLGGAVIRGISLNGEGPSARARCSGRIPMASNPSHGLTIIRVRVEILVAARPGGVIIMTAESPNRVIILTLLTWLVTSPSAYAEGESTISGFLFSKLINIGSRSEGPVYFLQEFNGSEVKIVKHAAPWQDDSQLRMNIATKVTIKGQSAGDGFAYTSIMKCLTSTKGCEIP